MSTAVSQLQGKELDEAKISSAVEEIKAIFTEAEFTAHEIIISANHEIGRIILGLPGEVGTNLQRVAEGTGRSERILWYAVKFAKTYKRVEDVPGGKNMTWHKIIRENLTTPKEMSEHIHSPISICSGCKVRLDGE